MVKKAVPKKANPNKFKDFKKRKVKVGKKAQPAANATKTEFSVKAIAIPAQKLLDIKGDLVNQRNLNLNDLLSQLAHHNVTVRKDAYLGLKDLFGRHPQLLSLELGPLLARVCEGMLDGDKGVRLALLALLTFLFPIIETAAMAPFIGLFLNYSSSAMSHLSPSIRLDSLAFFRLLLTHYPTLCWPHHRNLLPSFVHLLADLPQRRATTAGQHGAVAANVLGRDGGGVLQRMKQAASQKDR